MKTYVTLQRDHWSNSGQVYNEFYSKVTSLTAIGLLIKMNKKERYERISEWRIIYSSKISDKNTEKLLTKC